MSYNTYIKIHTSEGSFYVIDKYMKNVIQTENIDSLKLFRTSESSRRASKKYYEKNKAIISLKRRQKINNYGEKSITPNGLSNVSSSFGNF